MMTMLAVVLVSCMAAGATDLENTKGPLSEEGQMLMAKLEMVYDSVPIAVRDSDTGLEYPLAKPNKQGPLAVNAQTQGDGKTQVDVGFNMLQNPKKWTWGEWTTSLTGAAILVGTQTDWYGLDSSSSSSSSGGGNNPNTVGGNSLNLNLTGDSNSVNVFGSGSGGSGAQNGQESLTGAVAGTATGGSN